MNESKHGRDQHPRSALLDVAPASDSPSFQRFMWTIDAHLSKRGAKGAARAAAELVLAHLETAASSAKGSQRETDNRDCRLPQIRLCEQKNKIVGEKTYSDSDGYERRMGPQRIRACHSEVGTSSADHQHTQSL